eukprot:CAMPEP_0172297578 /NCGR_PEP_ID=MMETSP1058-20130122/543_1 /TAXON_ID=83371 /ORGANISM="Detonula confervacea, Strain CCMP 353" /LENGTH=63 /DNA_ID=CAMNT_0013006743 /DNA_START=13 /DNA_END=200 /DNA_ORIENTATION=+
MAVPKPNNGSSSSAQTAKEIKSLLQQLRKSSRQRLKIRSSDGNNPNAKSAIDRDDALRLDKLR